MNTHTFFCSEMDCSNTVVSSNMICADCWEANLTREPPDYEGCLGCGYYSTELADTNGYCGACWNQRFGCESPVPHQCGGCETCQLEYYEQCDDRYTPKCTNGCGPPAQGSTLCYTCINGERSAAYAVPLPPSPEPDYRTPDDLRDEIAVIEEKLRYHMTISQEADWERLLVRRRVLLEQYEAEMWEGYDKDDLRKLDLQCRR